LRKGRVFKPDAQSHTRYGIALKRFDDAYAAHLG